MSKTLELSPNALINKKVLDRYLALELPADKILATYIWIDGVDGINLLSKDRALDFVPKSPKGMLELQKLKILLSTKIAKKFNLSAMNDFGISVELM